MSVDFVNADALRVGVGLSFVVLWVMGWAVRGAVAVGEGVVCGALSRTKGTRGFVQDKRTKEMQQWRC